MSNNLCEHGMHPNDSCHLCADKENQEQELQLVHTSTVLHTLKEVHEHFPDVKDALMAVYTDEFGNSETRFYVHGMHRQRNMESDITSFVFINRWIVTIRDVGIHF